jgi:hypothetical protein
MELSMREIRSSLALSCHSRRADQALPLTTPRVTQTSTRIQ